MKFQPAVIMLLGVALNGTLVGAQTPSVDEEQRARQMLRKTIREQEAKGTGTSATRPGTPTYQELERQYLAHQITARQFQQYLREYKLVPLWEGPTAKTNLSAPTPTTPPVTAVAAPPPPPGGAKAAAVKPAQPPLPATVTEVESRMDELLLLKAARERAKTNVPPPAPGPASKRDRLNALLRQVVEGNLSDAEYKKMREKILAEPD